MTTAARASLAQGLPLAVAPDPDPAPADLWLVTVTDHAIPSVAARLAEKINIWGLPEFRATSEGGVIGEGARIGSNNVIKGGSNSGRMTRVIVCRPRLAT